MTGRGWPVGQGPSAGINHDDGGSGASHGGMGGMGGGVGYSAPSVGSVTHPTEYGSGGSPRSVSSQVYILIRSDDGQSTCLKPGLEIGGGPGANVFF